MRLLISNDDGIFAPGVRTLANTLAQAGHGVTVVCPDRERSATGHGLTVFDPIRAEEVTHLFAPGIRAWACSGTPSDCVKLALGALIDPWPDYVVSGINQGANLGTDILYSGTVSAAMEGVIEGIPSIAMSLASFTVRDFEPAAQFASDLLKALGKNPLPQATLLNVNVPPLPEADIAGAVITRQGLRRYHDQFQKRIDPRGKTYYWLAGEVMEDISQADGDFLTDVQALQQNLISITPLNYNLTDQAGLTPLGTWFRQTSIPIA
ncbi:5'/3'-nucleotidase SurE [Thermosynechococcaceae cyanobacterium BACA0444]|uniref:5'-nucleotidase SurE n=1 Tax=Pseudocalidococcus azoricus BACA0444 TaxID=2918990 RepID=A0AAE4JUB3_9CYAN|nr:5'/3'-nucleotidase SurE [Pseudocalidococcus azoricus]MDS3859185.1 5'/3'-nucleotidase SurE [Pseudocalidococcus azoricus BACA0444]